MMKQFPEHQRWPLGSFGNVQVILLGDQAAMQPLRHLTQAAFARIEDRFPGLVSHFPGLTIYFADGVITSGGEALAAQNAIIIDTTKALMTLQHAENYLVELGILNPGDWTALADADTIQGELAVVHELGHILEATVHREEGVAFADLRRVDATTKYGQLKAKEDYAEAFVYEVYRGSLERSRSDLILTDIAQIRQSGKP